MTTYASKTTVSPEKSRMEIEQTLRRYGADAFGYGIDGSRAVVTFRSHGRMVRFEIAVPLQRDFRTEGQRSQEERSRWRALLLVIKAKLQAVESGIVTFDQEFLSHLVLPDNTTVGEFILPQIAEAYESGQMPDMLPPARPALTRGTA